MKFQDIILACLLFDEQLYYEEPFNYWIWI